MVSIDDVEGSDRNHKHNKTPSMRKEKAHRRFSFGGVAQLGEHLFCKQKVAGSIPTACTED